MKKIVNLSKILLLIVLMVFVSCEDQLNVKIYNDITGSSFWKTPSDAEAAVVALHASFMDIMKSSNNQISNVDGRTDAWQPGTLGPRLTGAVEGHFQTANNGAGNWRGYYRLVHDCNLLLAKIGDIEFENVENKNDILAQTYTIRAMTYFELVRIFGDVPLVTEPTTGKPEPEDYKARAPRADVLNLIKADIDKALPLYSSNLKDVHFVSKLSTYALKAEVYMWSAKAYNARGSANTDDINTAISAIESIENSGELTFASDYSSIFTRDGNDSSEYILAVWYENGLSSSSYRYASIRNDAVPDQYKVFDGAGNIIKKLFPYALENEGIAAMSYGEALNDIYAKYQTVDVHDNPFDNNDDANVNDPGATPPTTAWYDRRDLRFINNCVDIPGPNNVVIKYAGIEDLSANVRWWDNDIPIYRLTGMLLLKAEAYNTLGNPEAAIDIMDMTRARAGLAPYPGARDQATVEDELLDESIRELFGENKRWWHLIREHRVADYVPRFLIERGQDRTSESVWDYYYWPIAESVLIANTKLVQSPGY
ncbi:hypothetical protein GCM10007962_30590 [Yeosuana aromativorans]|uniref:RagB/SusD family nutrient uptake outer membrane protein n=1 Tax=Yeosuana aromativorans TaxID=288019 RepID=A0A8J3FIK4_9FLAO|nr:RagB/SusD family nutrient uptake outer membrane protein [Yeosuana aromativorans]GGK34013.1 hypothetical protein GCM10007962_30590 [Yeosuana aromativorans]